MERRFPIAMKNLICGFFMRPYQQQKQQKTTKQQQQILLKIGK